MFQKNLGEQSWLLSQMIGDSAGAPNENIVQNHLNIALLNAF